MFAGFTNADGDMIHDIPSEHAEMGPARTGQVASEREYVVF
jgi:hypothetical protein